MKELSIEQKAKRYDEALERAKYYHDRDNIQFLENIFHELKESEDEDERIRKELMEFLVGKRIIGNDLEGINIDKTLVWLEKQNHDGKKWIYEDVYLKEKEQLIQDGIDEVLENPQKYSLEKQGEKSSSSWSKEDEDILIAIENHLREYYVEKKGYPYVADENSPEMKEYRWLKSLKDKVQLQTKQEWSKEDKLMLNDIIMCGEQHCQLDYGNIVWLKSLKQRLKRE